MKIEEKIKIVSERGFMIGDTEGWHDKYISHVTRAHARGLETHLSFEQYMDKALEAELDMPDDIGVRHGQYNLGRVGDVGNYEVANARFITAQQNRQEAVANGSFANHGEIVAARLRGQTKETYEPLRRMAETVTGRTKENHAGKAVQADKLAKEFVMTSPDGTQYVGKNLFEFCKKHGLHQGSTSKVVRGLQSNHKGWTGKYT